MMTRYIRKFRKNIGEIISIKMGKKTTLDQYWIIDTQHPKAIGVLFSPSFPYSLRWLERRLNKWNWKLVSTEKIPCAGKFKGLTFINIVVRYNEPKINTLVAGV